MIKKLAKMYLVFSLCASLAHAQNDEEKIQRFFVPPCCNVTVSDCANTPCPPVPCPPACSQGPQGIQGPVGPMGPQGPVGPMGPQGCPGPCGPCAIVGYAYADNNGAALVGADSDVVFGDTAVFPSACITPPAAGQTAFSVCKTGVYYIQFQVRGTPDTLLSCALLEFELRANGKSISGSRYAAINPSACWQVVNGYVLVCLQAGTLVTLHNVTNCGSQAVQLYTDNCGGLLVPTVNASVLMVELK